MKSASLRVVLAAFLIAAPAGAQTKPARATESADTDEARQHFQRGVDLYREGSFDAALAEFTKAYDLSPNYRVLFNLAQVQGERHDYVAALTLFEKYLQEGGSEIPIDRRDQVNRELSALRSRVARLSVDADVDGAELLIDGISAGTLPLKEPVLVSAGVRQIQVRKAGYEAAIKSETIAGGESAHVEFKLQPVAAAGPVSPTSPSGGTLTGTDAGATATTPEEAPNRAAFWVTLVSTGLFAGGAITFGVLTSSANSNLDQKLNTFPTDANALSDARSTVKRDALLTDIFTGAAVVSGAFCLYFGLSGSGHAKSGDTARAPLAIGPAGTGIRAFGHF